LVQTARIMQMKCLPVGDPFCVFEPYSGGKIKGCRLYLVKSEFRVSRRDLIIMFDKRYVLTTGFSLQALQQEYGSIRCKILYEWKPWRLVSNTIKDQIQKLWRDEKLTADQKKSIVNVTLGCLDKKFIRKCQSEFFTSKTEAWCKAMAIPDAEVLTISKNVEAPPNSVNDLDDFDLDDELGVPMMMRVDYYYLAVCKHKRALNEDFLPISFFKYDLQRLAMWKMYGVLAKAGFNFIFFAPFQWHNKYSCKQLLFLIKSNRRFS